MHSKFPRTLNLRKLSPLSLLYFFLFSPFFFPSFASHSSRPLFTSQQHGLLSLFLPHLIWLSVDKGPPSPTYPRCRQLLQVARHHSSHAIKKSLKKTNCLCSLKGVYNPSIDIYRESIKMILYGQITSSQFPYGCSFT